MLVSHLAAAALTALLFSAVFAAVTRLSRPKLTGTILGGLAAVFAILFVATWAGGLWMPALGPSSWGVPWLSFFVVGAMVAAIIAAAAVPHAFHGRGVAARGPADEGAPLIVVGTYFWMAIVLLLLVIVAAYATGELRSN